MAKTASRKRKPAAKPPPLIDDTAALAPDTHNPREITDEAAAGLGNSLNRFGDLSGIVFNRRTGQLVCGHRRMEQIRERYGDQPIEVIDEELACVRIDPAHVFTIRLVDWSMAKQRAANVAANSQKIAGTFTDDLADYLTEVQAEIAAEDATLLDDVLLTDYLIATQTQGQTTSTTIAVAVDPRYEVIAQCRDEDHQREAFGLLTGAGFQCKVSTH